MPQAAHESQQVREAVVWLYAGKTRDEVCELTGVSKNLASGIIRCASWPRVTLIEPLPSPIPPEIEAQFVEQAKAAGRGGRATVTRVDRIRTEWKKETRRKHLKAGAERLLEAHPELWDVIGWRPEPEPEPTPDTHELYLTAMNAMLALGHAMAREAGR